MFNKEKYYKLMPVFIARLYERVNLIENFNSRFDSIAEFICSKITKGNLLEVGIGPGNLISSINKINNNIKIYGIDVSQTMINLAKKKTDNNNVNLSVGSIEKTDFKNNYFDCITGSGTLYVWENKINCLNEIYRILKKNKSAYIFELYEDHDKTDFNNNLKKLLLKKNKLKQFIIKFFINQPLKRIITIKKFTEIIEKSKFKNSYKIEKVKFDGFNIWIRIKLIKK